MAFSQAIARRRLWPFGAVDGVGAALFRALGWFWIVVLAGIAGLALALQVLGPPQVKAGSVAEQAGRDHAEHGEQAHVGHLPVPGPVDRRISPPLPALLEPVPGRPGVFLPRVGADGLTPRRAYAAPSDAAPGVGPGVGDSRPRIGILLAGIGLNRADSTAAIDGLPGGVSLAFSPYAQQPEALLEAARGRGHEFLISLPLEPRDAPLHDAGPQALLAGATPEQNARRLDWSLGRIAGYVGATGTLGTLHGERFAGTGVPMREMLRTLAGRGLLYVDPRPGAAPPAGVAGTVVDLVIDSAPRQADIDRRLEELEQIARARGSALGLAGVPLPVTTGSLAAWAAGLEARGFVLAPVSALLAPDTASGGHGHAEHAR